MSSKKEMRLTVRFENTFYDTVEGYRKEHGLKTWVKALHSRDKENLQRIEELTSELNSLKKKELSIFDYMQKNGLENNVSTVEETPKHSSMDFSEVACEALGYNKNGKPFCIDPTAPISTQARRNLTWEVCVFCRKKKNKELEEVEKKEKEIQAKQQQEIKKFYEQKKRESHRFQERVNQTIANQKRNEKRFFTNEYGQRISY